MMKYQVIINLKLKNSECYNGTRKIKLNELALEGNPICTRYIWEVKWQR